MIIIESAAVSLGGELQLKPGGVLQSPANAEVFDSAQESLAVRGCQPVF